VPTFELQAASPADVTADLLILPYFKGHVPGPGVREAQKAIGEDLAGLLKEHRASGRIGETVSVPTFGRLKARTVLLVGLGPESEAGPAAVRRAAQKIGPRVAKFKSVATTLHQVGPAAESARALAEGLLLGTYRFDRYKERPIDEASQQPQELSKVTVLLKRAGDEKAVKEALRRGQISAESANWARDLVNTPALDATPEYLARQAQKMAKEVGLQCRVWTPDELRKGGFGGVLGVGAGSVNAPRFVEITYKGAGGATPIALTGKGVTFDSGGLSIKDSSGMETMKDDMGGGAATLAAMRAIALLKPKVNVIAAIPFSENLPSGSAIRPGDVLRHRGGKTSEVLNTDAEGRLILADALAFLSEKKPALILDCATLTGAAMVALGRDLWAVMGTDRRLIADVLKAGEEAGEPGWELPLWTEYRRHIESSVADVKNTGDRWGGAIMAGLFLAEFVDGAPWAHLDVASTAFTERATEYWPRGATGSPARTLVRFVEDYAANGSGSRARASKTSAKSSAKAATRSRTTARARKSSSAGRAKTRSGRRA
jgi:leucyl aminopeptidase